jgi:exonuclease VII small subunit
MSDDSTTRILSILAKLESGQAKLEAGQAKLESGLAGLTRVQAELGRAQAGLAERLDRTRIELMARMDRLQDALTLQQDETIVNLGAAERAERIATAAQDVVRSLSEQVTVMVRQIHRLQADVRELKGEA